MRRATNARIRRVNRAVTAHYSRALLTTRIRMYKRIRFNLILVHAKSVKLF